MNEYVIKMSLGEMNTLFQILDQVQVSGTESKRNLLSIMEKIESVANIELDRISVGEDGKEHDGNKQA